MAQSLYLDLPSRAPASGIFLVMAEIDNKKPEVDKPKPAVPETPETTAHTLTVFAQSLAYSAIGATARGAAQIVDHIVPTSLEGAVQSKLNNAHINKPEDAKYGTQAWKAEQFGNAIGMILPMWLSRKTMVGEAERALVKTASTEAHFTAALNQASIADKALREGRLSAKIGFIYGAVFTPSDDKSGSGNFVLDRAGQGVNSAVTFGAMGYSSSLTGGILKRAATSLESTALPSIFKSPLQTALHSSLVHGAISGIPSGIIQAQLGAMENGKPLADVQDIKEKVISLSMVGGVMGSAGLFKEAPARARVQQSLDLSTDFKSPPDDNHASMRHDETSHPVPEPVTEKIEPQTRELKKPANSFDIKFEPIEKAWKQEEVDKYQKVETRTISFAAKDRESKIPNADWNDFSSWGVEERNVPVHVYRFPGLKTEIVVPSDYVHILDRVRQQRLHPDNVLAPSANDQSASIDNVLRTHQHRILPEEIAQILKQLPQCDLVKTVELLDHANPTDLKLAHEKQSKLAADGMPEPDARFVSLADASMSGTGRMRFFASSTNNEIEMQETAAHEWAHLAQRDPAFGGFADAAQVERHGFFSRKYARENNSENWAVHLGERFLNPDGSAFSELPEKAPARTLIMAKALRNMLDERKDNPSPMHDQFLARTEAAEKLATMRLQSGILADIASGDKTALDEKLRFLHVAATSAQSPEIFARVLRPIEGQLVPVLEARGDDALANTILANRLAVQTSKNFVPEKMPEFIKHWRGSSEARARLFDALPEAGQKILLEDLTVNPANDTRYFLSRMVSSTDGEAQKMFSQTLNVAQENFEKQALALFRSNQVIPQAYDLWLENSSAPEARLASLKNKSFNVTEKGFGILIDKLQPSAIREMIVNDAMAYVNPDHKSQTWSTVLQKLPQDEQVKLFRELGNRHQKEYPELASAIETMTPFQFNELSDRIDKISLKLLAQREYDPAFIMSNPQLVKHPTAFFDLTAKLNPEQKAAFIEDGALRHISGKNLEYFVTRIAEAHQNRDAVNILSAIKPDIVSRARIEVLAALTKDIDPLVATKAEQVLIDVADKQYKTLRAEGLKHGGDAWESFRVLSRVLLSADSAQARLIRFNGDLPGQKDEHMASNMSVVASKLSEPEMLKFLNSGITDLLPDSQKLRFLESSFWSAPAAVKSKLRTMGDLGHLERSPESRTEKSDLTALRRDSISHPSAAKPVIERNQSQSALTGWFAHPLDIKFGPIEKAWQPDEVNKYRTEETRKIDFAARDRDKRVGQESWGKFDDWGVESREVPVHVYRFPGLTAEIVVPSDYARILDEARLRRLHPPEPVYKSYEAMKYETMAANDNRKFKHDNRILPEEIAQMIKQMPQPDLVTSIQLLDHYSPWDLQKNYENRAEAEAKGIKRIPDDDFIAGADAVIGDDRDYGRIRFFKGATNDPHHMQWLTAHEWSHLVQNDPAFKAFEQAAKLERRGFYERPYARENDDENWAVHFGERFLSASGERFSELPEKAPARTLVMAKALRNMLAQRKDNPSPRHQEFLARAQAAEDIATRRLQEGILADVASGNHKALDRKLRFLNVAASAARSPEIFVRVLQPIDAQLRPVLEARSVNDKVAKEVLINLEKL
jgi:hypothetical protein